MATILCMTSEVSGMLYTALELALRLERDGHRVTFAGFEASRTTIEAHGLPFRSLKSSDYPAFLKADEKIGVSRQWRRWNARLEEALASLAVDEVADLVAETAPDLLLIDGEMHEHIIAASASGVPIALLNTFVSIWRRPGLPPPHHLARPGVGWKGTRLGMWLLWQALQIHKESRAYSQALRRSGCDRLSLLRRLAKDNDFDFHGETDDSQWLIPFTYRRLPVLSLHALEFEFPHRPYDHVHYVGPMVPEKRADDQTTAAVRSELEAIDARRRTTKRALIYAGFGSFFTADRDFVRRLFEAVGERPDWEMVISLGGRAAPSDLGERPENVQIFKWVPQLDVLRLADVTVTHGGINTIDEAVLHGTPMLVYCGFETDMGGNTSRVVHHGLGLAGDRLRDSPATIRRQIDHLLTEPSFRVNVERMRTSYVAYTEQRVAERAVRSLLKP